MRVCKDGGRTADKTRITHINEGFDFLGQNLRKYDGKPLVKPSKKNTQVFLEKVRGLIDANKSASQTLLMAILNPVIRGWANYHRHCAATDTFNQVDHDIWRALWQWAKRRHPKISRAWVKKQCFPALGHRAWTFATETEKRTPDGKPILLRLVYFPPALVTLGGGDTYEELIEISIPLADAGLTLPSGIAAVSRGMRGIRLRR